MATRDIAELWKGEDPVEHTLAKRLNRRLPKGIWDMAEIRVPLLGPCGADLHLYLWVYHSEELFTFQGDPFGVFTRALSFDGNTLVISGPGRVWAVDVTGTPHRATILNKRKEAVGSSDEYVGVMWYGLDEVSQQTADTTTEKE